MARKLHTPPLSTEMGRPTESGVWGTGSFRDSSQIRSAAIAPGRDSTSCSVSKRADTLGLWVKVCSTSCGTEERGVPGVLKNRSLAAVVTSCDLTSAGNDGRLLRNWVKELGLPSRSERRAGVTGSW